MSVTTSTLWLATGTNLVMRGDMVRRSVVARLDPNVENPEYRNDFTIPDLIAWVRRNRMRLLSAVYTIFRGHAVAGHPCPTGAWDHSKTGQPECAGLYAGQAKRIQSQLNLTLQQKIQ